MYQYKREPLSIEEADRLFAVADTLQEKLCAFGLLETVVVSVSVVSVFRLWLFDI